mgnify:CR=1 FL=1
MILSTCGGVVSAINPDVHYGNFEVNDPTVEDIQDVVNRAQNGDTILINGSVKNKGTINSNKDLTIIGENNCIFDGVRWKQNNKNIKFMNIQFKNNVVWDDDDAKGGAIQANDVSELEVNNCTFENNLCHYEAKYDVYAEGGAISCIDGSVIAIDSNFSNNYAFHYGGAISSNKVELKNCIFDNNNVEEFCGGAINSFTSVNAKDSKFKSNRADNDGGAIWVDGDVSLNNCLFDFNTVSTDDGGAIYSNGKVNVCGSEFLDNHANCKGGAFVSHGKATVKDCSFNKNQVRKTSVCNDDGGAIYSYDSVDVYNSKFINNWAYDYGGAIWSDKGVNLDTCLFSNNSVEDNDGGAVYSNAGGVNIINSNFTNNKAYDYGGAIWSDDWVTVNGSKFVNNSVIDDNGGAIYMDDSFDLKVSHSAFYGNHAKGKGGAIYCEGNSAHVYLESFNSFENNTAKEGSAVFTDGYFGAILQNWWGTMKPNWDSGLLVEWKAIGPNKKHEDGSPLSYNPNL